MKEKQHKNKKKKFVILFVLIFCVTGLGSGMYLYAKSNQKGKMPKFIEDALAEDGRLKDGINNKKLMEQIQRETDKNKFGYGMNSKIEFYDGKSAGAMCIENPSTNTFDMQVLIRRDDTKEIIYTTASIAPGYGVESAKLHAQLEKGQYACTAVITAIKEGKKAGEIQMPVLIIIKN